MYIFFFYATVFFIFFINIIVFLAILKIESCLIGVNCAHLSYIVVEIIPTYLNPVNDTKLVFYCIVLI